LDLHLSPRSEAILRTLIDAYLVEGEPVGSRLLSKLIPGSLSSATIRNVLADLEDEDLVDQPHTSAGRVPTERAYRYYVDHWVRHPRPGAALEAQLASAFEALDAADDLTLWLRTATRTLSEAMRGICVALPTRLANSRLVRLEFVPLGSRRIVAIWVGSDGNVEHQILENLWDFQDTTLTELGNYATAHFAGCSLRELRDRLIQGLEGGVADGLHHALTDLASRMSLPQEGAAPAPLVVAGLGELGKAREFGEASRFRSLVEMFEQHERLAHLLNAFAEAAAGEVQLLLGKENPYLDAMPLATALRTVPVGGKDQVIFALVGPLRMDYAKLVGSLAWWSREAQRRKAGNG
jgi:heat-inducible transcriptional repressor